MKTRKKVSKRTVVAIRQKAYAAGEDPRPEQHEEVPSFSPGKPRIMVTWQVGESETRPAAKQWHGIDFPPNKPVSVEHLAPQVWDSMRKDIDAGDGWSYEYVIEHEEPTPEPEPEPPAEEPPPPTMRRSR